MAEKKPSKKDEHITELTDTIKRVQAEYENYMKRVERDRSETIRYASEGIIRKFLPILDNLELALVHAKHTDEFTKGIELIYASITELLEAEGIKPIEAQGLPFDPYRHEALMAKPSDEPKNTVLEVMQKGFTLHDRTIRPARVIVSAGPGGTKNE